jgi:hypothetical protein
MQIQRIGVYNNPYSSNKSQQSDASNLSFGQRSVAGLGRGSEGRSALSWLGSKLFGSGDSRELESQCRIVGLDEVAGIRESVEGVFGECAGRLAVKVREGVRLTVQRTSDGVSAWFSDMTADRDGQVQVAGSNIVEATTTAVKEAFAQFMESAQLDRIVEIRSVQRRPRIYVEA